MKNSDSKYKGAIALTTMLVVMAVLTASGIALVLTSINLRNSTRAYYNSKLASVYITNCLEESVDRLKIDKAFVGEIDIELDGGQCVVNVSDDEQAGVKILNISSTANSFNAVKEYRLDTSEYPFTLL